MKDKKRVQQEKRIKQATKKQLVPKADSTPRTPARQGAMRSKRFPSPASSHAILAFPEIDDDDKKRDADDDDKEDDDNGAVPSPQRLSGSASTRAYGR